MFVSFSLRDRHDDDLVAPDSAAGLNGKRQRTKFKTTFEFFRCVPKGRAKRVPVARCNMGQQTLGRRRDRLSGKEMKIWQ
jgi:hypothetical protein